MLCVTTTDSKKDFCIMNENLHIFPTHLPEGVCINNNNNNNKQSETIGNKCNT